MVKILPNYAALLPPLSEMRSILVIKLDAIGDCVLLSPFLKNLRSSCPKSKITIVAAKANRPLLDYCPVIDQRLFLAPDWHQSQSSVVATVAELKKLGPFDLAIVPRWEADYYGAGFLAKESQTRIRISYSASCLPRKLAADPKADEFYSHIIEDKENRHEIERNLLLLEQIGGKITDESTTIWLVDSDKAIVKKFLDQHHLPPKSFTVFAPGASLPHKIWPAKNWFEFAQRWLKEKQSSIVVTGSGEPDNQIATMLSLLDDKRVISAVNRFNPRESAALIAQSNGLIGADSFAKHAAAAFEIPVVEVSCHPEDGDPHNEYHPSRFGAWQTECHVVQPKTCGVSVPKDPLAQHPACIESVPVDDVMRASGIFS